jgi:hypothetical protein
MTAQSPKPEITFDSVDPLKFPENIPCRGGRRGDQFKEVRFICGPVIRRFDWHVAAVRPRRLRLFQFDRTGKFVREIGRTLRFMVAQQVRIDPWDNIWIVDRCEACHQVRSNGQVLMSAARKSRAVSLRRRRVVRRGWRRGAAVCLEPVLSGSVSRPPTWRDAAAHLRGRRVGANARGQVRQVASSSSRLAGDGVGQFNVVHRVRLMRRATSTSPTAETRGFRCSTGDGTFKTQIVGVTGPGRLHHARTAPDS